MMTGENNSDQLLYEAMVITIANSIGDGHEDLKNYAAKVCNIGGTELAKLDKKIEKLPKFKKQLKVTVEKAKNLLAMDANGLSDPYVKLSINGKKKRVKTNTIYKTLNPEWNEEFLIDLHEKDVAKSDLKLEIWDEDPRELCQVLGEIRELKYGGVRHYLRDVGEAIIATCFGINTDDFLGKASVALKTLSYDPKRMELQLAGKGKKIEPERGTLFLTLQLQCKQVTSHEDRTKQHLLLHRVCSECSSYRTSIEYRTLLEQHAAQNGINKTEQTICRCIASVLAKRNNISKDLQSYQEYYENLAELRNLMSQNGGAESHVCHFLKEMLNEALQKLINISAKAINNHLDEHLKSNNVRFQNLLKCLFLVREIKNCKIILPEVHEAIVQEAKSWFEMIFAQHKEKLEQLSTATETLQDIFKLFFERIRKADKQFETYADCPYTIFVYKVLDAAVTAKFKPIVERCCRWSLETQNLAVQRSLLPAYMRLKLLWTYIKPMKKEEEQLHLGNCSEWFPEELMESWFDMQTSLLTKYIEAAVVHKSIQEPFTKIINHLSNFHKMLEWPGNASAVSLFRIICCAVKSFAEKISDFHKDHETKDIEVYCQATRLIKEAQNYVVYQAKCEMLNIVHENICKDKINQLTLDTEKHTEIFRKLINEGCIATAISDAINESIKEIGTCRDEEKSKTLLQKMNSNLRGHIDYVHKNLDNPDFIAVLEFLWRNLLTLIEQQVDVICQQNSTTFFFFKSDVPSRGMLNLLDDLTSCFKIGLEGSQLEPERVNQVKEKLVKPPTRKSWASRMASVVAEKFFLEPTHQETSNQKEVPGISKETAVDEQRPLPEAQPPRKSWASRMASMVALKIFPEPALQDKLDHEKEVPGTSKETATDDQRPLPEAQPPRKSWTSRMASMVALKIFPEPAHQDRLDHEKEVPGTSKETATDDQRPLPEAQPPRKSWASTLASMVAPEPAHQETTEEERRPPDSSMQHQRRLPEQESPRKSWTSMMASMFK